MNEMNRLSDGTKVLAITSDKKQKKHEYLNEMEREVESLKLKYYMWLSRLFILFSVVSLLFFTCTSLSLFKLAPQVNVEPFLMINQDASSEIVRNEPISYDMASRDLILETFVKQYVILRNTIILDVKEMQSRWRPGGMLNFLSSWPVYYQFLDYYENNDELQAFDHSREVEILSVGRQGGKKSPVWRVDFKTYDIIIDLYSQKGGLKLKERYWTASLTAYFFTERQFVGRRLINPLGFTVVRYSQTEVEI